MDSLKVQKNEDLLSSVLEKAEEVRKQVNSTLKPSTRSSLGQFMTPSELSLLMASMFDDLSGNLDIIDAGAGTGALTAALLSRSLASFDVMKVSATCIECDDKMLRGLNETLQHCSKIFNSAGIPLKNVIVDEDFISYALGILDKDHVESSSFNKAILNPPYLKINSKSPERLAFRKIGIETGNLYSGFVAAVIKMLRPGGELVAITPRSFCNGPYFKPFRELIYSETAIKKIHVFDSRVKSFKSDNVLQENVIFHLVKAAPQEDIRISVSTSAEDDDHRERIEVASKVIDYNSEYKFIHIITSEEEASIAEKMSLLPCKLQDLNIEVSTGRVVDFRVKGHLREAIVERCVPLIYASNIKNGHIKWPLDHSKKPQAIVLDELTQKLMVPDGNYVLTKRFSSKEEKRRIVASVYQAEKTSFPFVGFDNRTNYFHQNGKGLDQTLARGLSLYLNSTLVDRYFRQFNGHTQVNATDLRSLKYPSLNALRLMAENYESSITSQAAIDSSVESILF